ncbi:MAG: hypothetical protein AB1405_17195 [Bdellovibrionota bacterium]
MLSKPISKLFAFLWPLAALFFLAVSPARAQIPGPEFDTLQGARSMGLGRAFSALADDPSAVRINPAGLSQAQAFTAGVSYQRNTDELNQHSFHLVDAKTTQMAVGLSYSIVNDNVLAVAGNDYDDAPVFSYLSLGLADSTIEKFKLGLTVSWLRVDNHLPDVPTATHDIELTVGALIPFKDFFGLQIGLVGRNLLGENDRYLARHFEVSAAGTPFKILRFAGAVQIDATSKEDADMGYGFGGEVEFVKNLRVRTGFRRDVGTRDHFLGGGVGFEGTEGGLIYAYERNLSLDTNQHMVELFFRWL